MHAGVHISSSTLRRHLLEAGRKLRNRSKAASYSKSENKKSDLSKIINIGL